MSIGTSWPGAWRALTSHFWSFLPPVVGAGGDALAAGPVSSARPRPAAAAAGRPAASAPARRRAARWRATAATSSETMWRMKDSPGCGAFREDCGGGATAVGNARAPPFVELTRARCRRRLGARGHGRERPTRSPIASRSTRAASISTRTCSPRRRHQVQRPGKDQRRGILRVRRLDPRGRRQEPRPLRQADDDQAEGRGRALFQGRRR